MPLFFEIDGRSNFELEIYKTPEYADLQEAQLLKQMYASLRRLKKTFTTIKTSQKKLFGQSRAALIAEVDKYCTLLAVLRDKLLTLDKAYASEVEGMELQVPLTRKLNKFVAKGWLESENAARLVDMMDILDSTILEKFKHLLQLLQQTGNQDQAPRAEILHVIDDILAAVLALRNSIQTCAIS